MPDFEQQPGLLYVVATLLPLASFVLLLLVGAVRNFVRKSPEGSSGAAVYNALGGDTATRGGAYVATGAIFLSFVLCLVGGILFLTSYEPYHSRHAALHKEIHALREKVPDHAEHLTAEQEKAKEKLEDAEGELKRLETGWKEKWTGRIAWARVGVRD